MCGEWLNVYTDDHTILEEDDINGVLEILREIY